VISSKIFKRLLFAAACPVIEWERALDWSALGESGPELELEELSQPYCFKL